jgi:hypothetical protein
MATMDGFNRLQSVGLVLRIQNNNALGNITGFNSVNPFIIGSDLTIAVLNNLKFISGFNGLYSVGQSFGIQTSSSLVTMKDGFRNLTAVASSFVINAVCLSSSLGDLQPRSHFISIMCMCRTLLCSIWMVSITWFK